MLGQLRSAPAISMTSSEGRPAYPFLLIVYFPLVVAMRCHDLTNLLPAAFLCTYRGLNGGGPVLSNYHLSPGVAYRRPLLRFMHAIGVSANVLLWYLQTQRLLWRSSPNPSTNLDLPALFRAYGVLTRFLDPLNGGISSTPRLSFPSRPAVAVSRPKGFKAGCLSCPRGATQCGRAAAMGAPRYWQLFERQRRIILYGG